MAIAGVSAGVVSLTALLFVAGAGCADDSTTITVPIESLWLDGESTVRAHVVVGGCQRASGLQVAEDEFAVVVRAEAHVRRGDCPAVSGIEPLATHLDEPLADRELVIDIGSRP